ncbi:hypothetical protein LG634_24530 [Streptomyces bambusae]|uniref:hypothetical protein n=1 Tax=Streptomyces bambusae TaxID=1550616 RepID=UPI001CFC5EBC|nr:hypothetical protein [Streptomyces bambusae]MCB5167981.1 hypothetical protein [Streptomyces bambusae]
MKSTTDEVLLPPCTLAEHELCKPDEVRTCYGDVALPARRCDCSCHWSEPYRQDGLFSQFGLSEPPARRYGGREVRQ